MLQWRLILWLLSTTTCLACDHHGQSSHPSKERLRRHSTTRELLVDGATIDSDNDLLFGCGFETPPLEETLLLEIVHQNWLMQQENTRRNLAAESIVIPVAITVFVNSTVEKAPRNGWLNDTMIKDIFATLNYGYRGTPFQFQLMQLKHVYNLSYFDCQNEYEYKSKHRVPKRNVINMYYCNTFALDPTLLGYTYTPARINAAPEQDGVVYINPALVYGTPMQKSALQTAIHEVGHWFGLLHTWEGR
jgi:hypothetical protein